MSEWQLSTSRIKQGVWRGQLQGGEGEPSIEVLHLNEPLADVAVSEMDGAWYAELLIPVETIGDGVQTFLVLNKSTGEKLGQFSLIAGEALGDDLRVEVDLLRAELDMLKRAFRRHCVETA